MCHYSPMNVRYTMSYKLNPKSKCFVHTIGVAFTLLCLCAPIHHPNPVPSHLTSTSDVLARQCPEDATYENCITSHNLDVLQLTSYLG